MVESILEELQVNISRLSTLPEHMEKEIARTRLVNELAMLPEPDVALLMKVLDLGKSTIYAWNIPMNWVDVYNKVKREYPRRFKRLESYIATEAGKKRAWIEARL